MSKTRTIFVCLNSGSSSLKAACFTAGRREPAVMRWEAKRLGAPDAFLTQSYPTKDPLALGNGRDPAIRAILSEIASQGEIQAVAHRIVHPGLALHAHQPITSAVRAQLEQAVELDRTHLPVALAVLAEATIAFSGAKQFACLDTAFHHQMPRGAQLLGIPRTWLDRGIRRLGFHGLSYTYLMDELERLDGPAAANGRVILAHLGSGASMAAVRHRKCLDTSMGFTPLAGLIMATRPGDLDPGVVAYLAQQENLDAKGLDDMLSSRCGLFGVSGSTGDMQKLLSARTHDTAAADAVSLFIHQARRWLGSLAVAAGGVDTLIFTGGVGQHASAIRAGIVENLDFLGIELDRSANQVNGEIISTAASRVRIRVMATDEESVMADILRKFCPLASPSIGQP